MLKERALATAEATAATEGDFALKRGIGVAVVSGVLSACFAFGLAAGAHIAERATASGAPALFANNATLVVILLGGFTTNGLYALGLNAARGTWRDYASAEAPGLRNAAWSALGGLTWYLQFFFYGMGESLLGERFGFASWTLHMAFIIFFSTAWGLYLREWSAAGAASWRALWWGLGLVAASTVVIGAGSWV